MLNQDTAKGHCLCGKVSVTAPSMKNKVWACHCDMCRRWGGGPLMSVDCGNDVSFEGEDHIAVYDSSDWAQRGFCRNCGTHLFYRMKADNQYFMPVGIFDDREGFVFRLQVFIDKKPAYYSFSNDTKNMTGAEVFAKFAP